MMPKCNDGCGKTAGTSGYCRRCYLRLRHQKTSGQGQNAKGPVSAFNETEHKKVKRLHSQFKTHAEISRIMGVSTGTISRALKPGYTPRPDDIRPDDTEI